MTGKYITAFEPRFDFVYLPYSQHRQARMTLIAATYGDPASLTASLQTVVHSIDPLVPVVAVRTMEDLFDQRSIKVGHMIIGIAGVLAMMGLILALVGLYAVVAYQVGRRTREIGIRVALGAARTQVIAMILKETAWMSLAGIAIGSLVGLSGNHMLSQGITVAGAAPISLSLSAAVIVTLLLTTFLAVTIPARRASRIDPQHALRQD